MICSFCKDDAHSLCLKKHRVGGQCDCIPCREEYLKTLRIDDVQVKNGGRCLMIRIGNSTNFIDVRDLHVSPSWLDREDNRQEALEKIRSDKNES